MTHHSAKRPFKYLSILLLGITPATGLCVNWQYVDASFGDVDFVPQQRPYAADIVATPDGYWLGGTLGGRNALALYRLDGALAKISYADVPGESLIGSGGANVIAASTDGGVFAISDRSGEQQGSICNITRHAADGTVRWNIFISRSCGKFIGVDGGNGLWLGGAVPVRISQDGAVIGGAKTPIDFHNDALAVNARGPGLLHAFGNPFGTPASPEAIEMIDADGMTHPIWQAPDNSYSIVRLISDSTGNIDAVGATADGRLHVSNITAAGALRWSNSYAALHGSSISAFAGFDDGALGLLTDDNVVVKLGNDGVLRFANALDASTTCDYFAPQLVPCALATSGDDLLALAATTDGKSRYYRYASDGSALAAEGYDNTAPIGVVALADGSAMIELVSAPGATQSSFVHLDRNGAPASAPTLAHAIAADSNLVAAAAAVDGTQYLLTQDNHDQHALSRIATDGSLVWQHRYSGTWYYRTAQLTLRNDRICVGGPDVRIDCYATDSGQTLWTYIGDATSSLLLAWNLLDDDTVVVIEHPSTDYYDTSHTRFFRISATGQISAPVDLGLNYAQARIAFNSSGTTVISDFAGDRHSYAFDRDGKQLYEAATPILSDYPQDVKIAVSADGTAVIENYLGQTSDNSYGHYLSAQSSTGAPLWKLPISAGYYVASLAIDGSRLYLSLGTVSGPVTYFAIEAHSLRDGSEIWRTADSPDDAVHRDGDFVFGADSSLPLVLAGGSKLFRHALLLNRNDGSLVRDLIQPCNNDYCGPASAMALANDGSLRITTDTIDPVHGNHVYVYAIANALIAPSSIPLTQAALDGVWYAPYSTGQGFTLDYIASSNTLFIPWFTYQTNGINNLSGLAWYSLQGTVDSGATQATLGIYSSTGGNFNSGKIGSIAVGTARLNFSDCNHGIVQYRFNSDTNNAATGEIALTRLTPLVSACTLADGSVQLPAVSPAPAQGFDSRQSGSWYDPNTSGQGIELTIVPPSSGSSGLFFGAWYTYDPKGNVNDAQRQHWFTVQGDFSAATSGKVVVPIYQTLGGAFDSTPTRNLSRVGEATFTMLACDRAHLDYLFDSSDTAHAFSGISGAIDMVKIGGCSAP